MRRFDPAIWALRLVVLVFAILMLAPILVVVAVGFTSAGYVSFPLPGVSLQWFARVISYAPFMRALWVSLEVAIGATMISCLLGIPAALARRQSSMSS